MPAENSLGLLRVVVEASKDCLGLLGIVASFWELLGAAWDVVGCLGLKGW